MSNKENRIKSLPDVLCLAGLVQFKYIQDISEPNDVLRLCWYGWGH